MAFLAETSFNLLRQAFLKNRLAHAYLITGPRGSGKRRLAMRLARLVNSIEDSGSELNHPDIHVIEPESKSRRILIEQTRDIEKELQMRSFLGGTKVCIIIDADRLQVQAANAFLKTLEEPPPRSLLILTTAQPEAMIETVVSRCIEVPLRLAERVESTLLQLAMLEGMRNLKSTGDLASVFEAARLFSELLSKVRAEIGTEMADRFKAEESRYKQTTECREWLEAREEYYKALTEARFLQERSALVDVLLEWWTDVARQQNGSPHLDLPERRNDTAVLAANVSPAGVLEKIDAFEELRANFNRPGVQEQLAIETAFLRAFTDGN